MQKPITNKKKPHIFCGLLKIIILTLGKRNLQSSKPAH